MSLPKAAITLTSSAVLKAAPSCFKLLSTSAKVMVQTARKEAARSEATRREVRDRICARLLRKAMTQDQQLLMNQTETQRILWMRAH